MVLKRKKSIKNICKSIVRPSLVLSSAVSAENKTITIEENNLTCDPSALAAPISVSSLNISSRRNSAIADVSLFLQLIA